MPNGGRGDEPDYRSLYHSLELIGQQLLDSFDRCDTGDGWFSQIAHDSRCEADWRDVCTCGADDLRAAFARLTAALLIEREL